MNFLRNLLASILGCIVAFAIIMGMFFFLMALTGSADKGVVGKENSVLELGLSAPIMDYAGMGPGDPFAALETRPLALDDILHGIEVAKTDNKIKGISMTSGML